MNNPQISSPDSFIGYPEACDYPVEDTIWRSMFGQRTPIQQKLFCFYADLAMEKDDWEVDYFEYYSSIYGPTPDGCYVVDYQNYDPAVLITVRGTTTGDDSSPYLSRVITTWIPAPVPNYPPNSLLRVKKTYAEVLNCVRPFVPANSPLPQGGLAKVAASKWSPIRESVNSPTLGDLMVSKPKRNIRSTNLPLSQGGLVKKANVNKSSCSPTKQEMEHREKYQRWDLYRWLNEISRSRSMIRGRGASSVSRGRARLSDCAAAYLRVLEDPFSGQVACLPGTPNFPTMKHSVRASGTFSTGTVGFGYVCLVPYKGMFHDTACVNGSQPSYNGESIAAPNTQGQFSVPTNSLYDDTLSPAELKCRLVAAGLRVRNVTAQLNRGGSVVGAESLNHSPVNGMDIPALMLMDTTERLSAMSNDWLSVVWHPQDEDETDYITGDQANNSDLYNVATLAFAAQNGTDAASQQTYEWEAYVVFEAKGQSVHGLTPSMSDPVGLAAAQNATASVAARKPHSGERLSRVASALGNAANYVTQIIPPLAEIAAQVLPAIRGGPQLIRGAARIARAAATRGVIRGARAAARAAYQRIADRAYSTTEQVPFPVVLPSGEVDLAVVFFDSAAVDTGGRSLDGYIIQGYEGTLNIETGSPLTMSLVNSDDWLSGLITYKQGPLIVDQSCQHAVYRLLHHIEGRPDQVFTGEWDKVRRTYKGGTYYSQKVHQLSLLGLTVILRPTLC